jgi:anti-sigma regulatory factor (Ser/Thr protein kinase)
MNEISILNRGSEVARVAILLDQLGAAHHLAPEVLADMQVALDEVLKNLIDYAYPDDAAHEILLRFEVSDNVLEAVIEDDGVPFDPLSSPKPDLRTPLRERQPGGLGLHFVRNLMSEVIYDRVGNRNRLVLRKHLKR